MKRSLLFLLLSLILVLSGLFVKSANSNIIITGTRVIYPSNAKSITVKMTNSGSSPELVQSSIEEGETKKNSNKKVPFLLTPPIVRVEPNSSQELRIIFTGEQTLSSEVEHLYWLNILDIPSKVKSPTGNQLAFAINSRLKLFYRPFHLKQPSKYDFDKLKFSIKENKLMIENPTPYYISLVDINFSCDSNFKPLTIKPLSTYSVCSTHKKRLDKSFSYSVIGDYGAIRTFQKSD